MSTTGSDGSTCQNSASPCRTIQYAIDQALTGDTVNLGAGTFAGTGNTEILLTRDIDLTFEGAGTNQTTIDGAGTANLFRFDTPSAASMDIAFRDLALVNGDGDGPFGSIGAAIQEEYWVTLSLELTRVLVEDNTSSGDGGAIRTRNGNVTIHDSTFSNNQSNLGGAIRANTVTISSTQPEVTAPTTLFVGNAASGEGGAISAKKVVASDVVFEANVAGGDGGAISIGTDPTAEATAIKLTDAVFEGNGASTGGAFRVSRAGVVEITDTVFDSNQASNSGGVMRVDSPGQVTVARSTIANNSATNAFAVGDLFQRDLTLTESTVNGNSTTGPFVFAAKEVAVDNSTLTGNATDSNFIYSNGGDIRLRSTTSSANAISSGHFFPTGGGSLDVANSIINESGTSVCSFGPLVNGGGNVLTTTVSSDCDGLVGPSPAVKVPAVDLTLGSLADNGGPTKTMALGLESIALGVSGSSTPCPAVDQRGKLRPPSSCDSGAFELQSHPLTVAKAGTGDGTVAGTSTPSGGGTIDCGSTCSASFNDGSTVTLTATPASGSTFTGWSGAGCSGTGPCTVTVSQAETVTATFSLISTYSLNVNKSGTGSGGVTSNPTGIDCGDDCSESYQDGTSVTLTATPASGSTFTGWSGAGCSGTGTCEVTMSEAKSVDASFTADSPTPTGKPKLRISLTTPKKIRAGKGFPVKVKTSNVAQAPLSTSTRSATTASDVKTCAKLSRGLFVVKSGGGKVSGRTVCWTRSSLAAGRSVTYKATVRTSKSLSVSARVSGTVSASNDSGATVRASGSSRVRVIEPKRPKPKPPTG